MNYKEKMDKMSSLFIVSFITCIILYICLSKQEDGSTGAIILALLLLIDIVCAITAVVKYNIYNSKSKNMSPSEYMHDRFSNAIPETKEVFRVSQASLPDSIKCPSCGAGHNKIKKISTMNRAVSIGVVGLASNKIGKQFECTSCHYKW